MKNTIKLFGIIAITAVIGILASCASMTLVAIDTIEGPRQVRQGDDITPRDIVVYGLYKNGDRKVISNITASNITFDKNAVGPQTVRVRSGSQAGSFQTEVMALVSLTITSQLTNTSIRQGQEMNSWPGLAVQGEWDQMGTQNIPIPSLEITGYNGDRVGSQVITISYLGKTASFNVDVKALRSIQITQPPAKVDYFQGESLNLAGLQVTGQWDGLPDELIPLTRITTSGLPANVGQQQRVTVTVSGQTANFFVNVAVGQLVWRQANVESIYGGGIITGLAYGGNRFLSFGAVIVGADTVPKFAYSENGVNWTEAPIDSPLSCAAYGNNRWVAGSTEGKVYYSDNGTRWTAVDASRAFGSAGISFIAFGNGRWTATGTVSNWDSNYNLTFEPKMAYSTTGTTWTAVDISGIFGGKQINGIAYGSNRWVAVGGGGTIAYSDNGTAWTAVNTRIFGENAVNGIVYGNNRWIATSGVADSPVKMAYSDNGTTWTAVNTSTVFGESGIYAIAYANNRWVAGSEEGKMAFSTDGISWTAVQDSSFGNLGIISLAYGSNRWVASGYTLDIADGELKILHRLAYTE